MPPSSAPSIANDGESADEVGDASDAREAGDEDDEVDEVGAVEDGEATSDGDDEVGDVGDDLGDGTWEWYFDINSSHLEHNHELTPMEFSKHDPGARHFPPWAVDMMESLKTSFSPADIVRAIEDYAYKHDVPVTWLNRDVYNHLQLSEEVKAMDAALLLDWCEKQKEQSAFFDYRKDIDKVTGRLKSVVYMSHDGYQHYQTFNDVMFLDVTHGTNKLAMKLALFVTFDGEGFTRVLGAALLPNETKESLDFMLSSFMELVGGVQPSVCFTDEDAWLRDAIERHMPKTKLLLCVLHLWQGRLFNYLFARLALLTLTLYLRLNSCINKRGYYC